MVVGLLIISCIPEKERQLHHNASIQQIGINDSVIIIDLDQTQSDEAYLVSSLFKKVTPIILETCDEALLLDTQKIEIYEDYIFVFDSAMAKCLFLFDKKGNFIRQISRTGQGPGEYLRLSDFTVDKTNGLVYILDDALQRISAFKISDGSFVNSVNLQNDNGGSFYLQCVDGKMYADMNLVSNSREDYMLREIDINTGKQLGGWLRNELYNKGFSYKTSGHIVSSNPFYRLPYSGVKFAGFFSDTIISIDKTSIKPFLVINSNEFVSREYLESLKIDGNIDPFSLFRLDGISRIEILFESRDLICFTYNNSYFIRTVIYNKSTNNYENVASLDDDLVYKIDLEKHQTAQILNVKYSDTNGIYTSADGGYLDKLREIAKDNGLNLPEGDVEKLKGLTEDSNPVLFYYEYK